MKYDEQYWKDYTFFIAEVERIGKSPSDFLESYEELVQEIENCNLIPRLSNWEPEEMDHAEQMLAELIQDIHCILNINELKSNALYANFAEKVLALDERMRLHTKPKFLDNDIWIREFNLTMLKDAHR